MMFNSNPIVGKNANGESLLLMVTNDNQAVTSRYVDSMNKSTGVSSTVDAIAASPDGLLALGTMTKKDGVTHKIAWLYKNSNWQIGSVASLTTPGRVDGVGYTSNHSYVISGATIAESQFNIKQSLACNGVSLEPEITQNAVAISTNHISSGSSVTVAASDSSTGTLTSDFWNTHHIGELVQVPSGHHSTSYTFPGYSGANAQIQQTISMLNDPIDNKPNTRWDNTIRANAILLGSETTSGYHGVTNKPVLTVVRDNDLVATLLESAK